MGDRLYFREHIELDAPLAFQAPNFHTRPLTSPEPVRKSSTSPESLVSILVPVRNSSPEIVFGADFAKQVG